MNASRTASLSPIHNAAFAAPCTGTYGNTVPKRISLNRKALGTIDNSMKILKYEQN